MRTLQSQEFRQVNSSGLRLPLLDTNHAFSVLQKIFLVDGANAREERISDGKDTQGFIIPGWEGNTGVREGDRLCTGTQGGYQDMYPAAPVIKLSIGIPYHITTNGKVFITGNTPLTLTVPGASGHRGAAWMRYRVNGSNWVVINSTEYTFTITGQDTGYLIEYASCDNSGSLEQTKCLLVNLDNAAPVIRLYVENLETSEIVYLPDNVETIELTDNEKISAVVVDAKERPGNECILPVECSELAYTAFRINGGDWMELTPDNLDPALRGLEEAYIELIAMDNVCNMVMKSYTISHYALFSVPGAAVSVTGDVMLNSGILIDSFNSSGAACNTGNGDVYAKGKITLNSNPRVNGGCYAYTDTGISPVPVPPAAGMIGRMIINSNEERVLEQGAYYIKELIVNAHSRLIIRGGWVKIWFDSCTIEGEIVVDKVKHLWMVGTGKTRWLSLTGPARFKGILFAPAAQINVHKKVEGSVIGKTVIVNSGAVILYDEDSRIHDRWK